MSCLEQARVKQELALLEKRQNVVRSKEEREDRVAAAEAEFDCKRSELPRLEIKAEGECPVKFAKFYAAHYRLHIDTKDNLSSDKGKPVAL